MKRREKKLSVMDWVLVGLKRLEAFQQAQQKNACLPA